MRNLSVAFACILAQASLGQSPQDNPVAQWQKIHPNVLFVEKSDFTTELQTRLQTLKKEFIVYDQEITMELINSYYPSSIQKAAELDSDDRVNEAESVKIWVGQHRDVKIVPRTLFEAQDAAEQDAVTSAGAMVLQGETITLQDIEIYEATH